MCPKDDRPHAFPTRSLRKKSGAGLHGSRTLTLRVPARLLGHHSVPASSHPALSPVLAVSLHLESIAMQDWGLADNEMFGVIHLDSRNRLIAVQNLFRGTSDVCTVYTREVVQSVLEHRAAAVVLYHNHPSGAARASFNPLSTEAVPSESRRGTATLRH
jgi:hypothetical protein